MEYKFNSRRSPIYSTNGMVASSQPLASEVGLSILKKGGNAADAAVAVAAALHVVEPQSTGLGGDMFCLFFNNETKSIQSINGSGRCSKNLSIEYFEKLGYNEANRPPNTSPLWITTPGAAAGWVDTITHFGSGKLTLEEILEPGVSLAENGFPVNVVSSHTWKNAEKLLQSSPNGIELLPSQGMAPSVGKLVKLPTLAKTFRILGREGKKAFYEGQIAEAIVSIVKEAGGVLTLEDLKTHTSTFEDPISINYRGFDILECPPNGQGITALIALNILEGFDLSAVNSQSGEHLHLMIESLRLAFSDTRYYVTDPAFYNVPTKGLISKSYAQQRRSLISLDSAIPCVEHGYPERQSNTVYFCVVDGTGNACSFINSVYTKFGSGVVPIGYGFALQNRGDNFSLDRNHPNCLQPGKRTYHTIIPGMAMKHGELYCSFGVMGGFMQPQGHLQVLSNLIDYGMDPQTALDTSRFIIQDGKANGIILLEDGISEEARKKLVAIGHRIKTGNVTGFDRLEFGVGQIILRNPLNGVMCGGSDPRNDGLVIGW